MRWLMRLLVGGGGRRLGSVSGRDLPEASDAASCAGGSGLARRRAEPGERGSRRGDGRPRQRRCGAPGPAHGGTAIQHRRSLTPPYGRAGPGARPRHCSAGTHRRPLIGAGGPAVARVRRPAQSRRGGRAGVGREAAGPGAERGSDPGRRAAGGNGAGGAIAARDHGLRSAPGADRMAPRRARSSSRSGTLGWHIGRE